MYDHLTLDKINRMIFFLSRSDNQSQELKNLMDEAEKRVENGEEATKESFVQNGDFEEGFDYDLEKAGEGSKGGKIIGHTKSGKPIYDSPAHHSYKSFSTEDHEDASQLHSKLFTEKTSAYLEKYKGKKMFMNKNEYPEEYAEKLKEHADIHQHLSNIATHAVLNNRKRSKTKELETHPKEIQNLYKKKINMDQKSTDYFNKLIRRGAV